MSSSPSKRDKRDSVGSSDPTTNTHGLTNRVSTNDLKNQLVDLQKKLSSSRRSSSVISNSNSANINHSPTQPLVTSRNTKRSSLAQQNENLEPPIHLPPVSLTAFQDELRTSRRETHSSLTRNRRSHQPTSNASNRFSAPPTQSANVDFLSDLSDGLLIESRRLQADNKHLKQELSKQKEENSTILKQIQNLTILNNKLSEQEESLQDKNWDLESELNKYKRNLTESNQELAKVRKRHDTNSSELTDLRNELDTLTTLKNSLMTDLGATRAKYDSDVKELKKRVIDLNDENDNLHLKNQKLNDLVDQSKSVTLTDRNIPILTPINDEHIDDEDIKDILNDPTLFQSQLNNNHELEKETLKTNLNHAHSSLLKLRNHLLKLRTENQDLEKRLSSTKSPSKSTSPNKSSKKPTTTPRKSLSPNKRGSKNSSYEEADESNLGWENYSDDDNQHTINSTSTRGGIHKLSKSMATNNDTDDTDEESGFQFVNSSSNTINSKSNKKTNKFLSDELHELEKDDDRPVLINRESVEKYAIDNGLVIVSTDEYEELKASHQSVATSAKLNENDLLIKAATSFDVLALPNDSRSLQSNSSSSIIENLKQKCQEFNLVPLTFEEHENLVSLSQREPSEAELISKIEQKGLVVLKTSEHNDLLQNKKLSISQSDDLNSLQSQLSSKDDELTVLQSQLSSKDDELTTLQSQLSSKDDKLTELSTQLVFKSDELTTLKTELTAQSENLVVLHSQLTSKSEELSSAEEKLALQGSELISYVDKLKSFEDRLSQPDLAYLQEKATQKSMILLPTNEHQKLVKDLNGTKDQLQNPSLQYITEKIGSSHSDKVKLLAVDEYQKFIDISKQLDDKIVQLSSMQKELDTKIAESKSVKTELESKQKDIEQYQEKLNSPDLEYIRSKAMESHQMTVVPSEEHETMKVELQKANSGLSELQKQVSDKLTELADKDVQLTTQRDEIATNLKKIETLKSQLDSPSLEFINTKSGKLGYKVVEESKYIDLQSQLDDYSKEITQLQNNVQQPDLQYIMEKSSSHNHVVIPIDEHNKLNETIKSHSNEIDSLKSSLDKTQKKLDSTVTKLENPDLDYIVQKSSSHDHVVIPVEVHKGLEDKLQSHENEISELRAVVDSKSKELNTAKSALESPDLEYIMEKSSSHRHVVIPVEEHKELTGTVTAHGDEIKNLKATLDSKDKELKEIKTKLDKPNLEYIMEKSSSHGHVLIPETEHKDLTSKAEEIVDLKTNLSAKDKELEIVKDKLEKPDLDYIMAKSSSHGHILLPLDEHKQLTGTVTAHGDEIKNLKATLVSKDKELKEIKTKLDKPDLEYIMEKSSSHGHVLIPETEHKDLTSKAEEIVDLKTNLSAKDKELEIVKDKLETPDLDYIMEKSSSHNHIVLPVAEHKELNNQLKAHSDEIVNLKTSLTNNVKELETTKAQLEKPNLNYIINKSSSHGHIVIPVEEHKKLTGTVESQADEICNLKASLDSNKKELSDAHSRLENPDLGYIKGKAGIHGHEVVSSDQLKNYTDEISNHKSKISELEKTLSDPSEEYLRAKAESKYLVLLPVEEHNTLKANIENPSVEAAKKVLDNSSSYKVITASELKKLENPSKDALISRAPGLGLVAVEANAYKSMKAKVEKPSLAFLTANLGTYSYKAIPQKDFDSMSKSIAAASTTGGTLGAAGSSVLGGTASVAAAGVSGAVGAVGAAGALGAALVTDLTLGLTGPKRNYGSNANSPNNSAPSSPISRKYSFESGVETMDSLKKKCTEMGLVAVSKSTYESSIISSKRQLTFVELKERVEQLAQIMLPKAEFDELLNIFGSQGPAFRNALNQLARSGGDHATALIELRTLTDNQNKAIATLEHPNVDYFKEKASDLGLFVLPLNDYKKLQSGVDLHKNAKAKGFVLVKQDDHDASQASFTSQQARITDLETQLESALNPTLDVCLAVVSKDQGYKVMSSDEFNQLLESVETPSKEKVIDTAKVYALVTLTNEEHQGMLSQLDALKEQIENPDVDHMKKRLSTHNLIALPVSDHDELKSLVATKDKELSSISDELLSHKSEVEKVNKELESTRALHESVSTELDSHKAEVERVNKELESTKALHQTVSTELDSHRAEIERVNKELESAKAMHKSVSTELDSHKELVEKANIEVTSANALHEAATTELEAHKEQVASLKDEIVSLKEIAANKEAEMKTLCEQHESLKTDINEKSKAINDLNTLIESPDLDYLHTKAASHKMILTSSEDHDGLKSKLGDGAKQLEDLQALHDSKAAEIDELKQLLDSNEAEIKNLREQLESPELDYIKTKAVSHEMVVVPSDEHSSLKTELDTKQRAVEQHVSDIASIKEQLGAKSKELDAINSELTELKVSYETPSKEYIMEKAGSHSLVLLSSDEHDLLQRDLAERQTEVEKHSADVILIKEQLESKSKEIESLTAQLQAKQSELDELDDSFKAPSKDYIMEKATSHSMVVMSSDDHDGLQRELSSKHEELEKHATDITLLKEQLEAKSLEMDNLTAELESKKNELVTVNEQYHSPSVEYIKEKANRHSLATIPVDDHSNMLNDLTTKDANIESINLELSSKAAEIETLNNAIEEAKTKHDELSATIVVKDEELEVLKQNIATKTVELEELNEKLENPDLEYIKQKAIVHDAVAVDNKSYRELQSTVERPPASYITSKAGIYGLKVLTLEEYNALLKELEDSKAALAQLQGLSNGSSFIHDRAKELGMFVIPQAEYDALKALEKENTELKNSSKEVKPVLPVLQNMSVESIQTNSNSVYVDAVSSMEEDDDDNQSDHSSIFDSNDVDQLREKAAELGYDLVPIQEYGDDDTSIESIEDDEVDGDEVSDIHQLGTAQIERIDAGSSFDPEELKVKAAVLGYELVDIKELERLKGFENVDLVRLRDLAAQLGMTVTDPSVASVREIKGISLETLQASASSMGYLVLSKSDIERLKKRNITTQELAAKAAELNLSLLSEADVQAMKTSRELSLDALQSESSAKGFMMIPNAQFVATTVSRRPDVNNVIVLPSTYYNKLIRSHEWYKKNGMKSELSAQTMPSTYAPPSIATPQVASYNDSDLISHSDSVAPYSPHDSPNLPNSPDYNNRVFSLSDLARQHSRTALSLHTVDSTISFSSRDMISVITQTIIGEYLFKYYRRLGPFSSLSESRHERYFWIHPYSLTLYWSTSNPVLGDPSENKIRAIAIVSAESVEDKNPLPPGIYHKSIIIHSHDRSIKITCPTRQRHNIWFNSLRYLIERSTDDLVDDDDIENQYNETYSVDEKLEIERSQSFRHDRPKNNLTQHMIQNNESGQRSMSAQLPRNSTKSMIGSIVSGAHNHQGQRNSRFR